MKLKLVKTFRCTAGILVAALVLAIGFSGCSKKNSGDDGALLSEKEIETRLVEMALDTLKNGTPPSQTDLDPIINAMAVLDDSVNETILENVGIKAEKEAGGQNMLANFDKLFWIFELAMQVQAKKVETMDSQSQGAIQPIIDSIVDISRKVVSDKNYSISDATVDDLRSRIKQLDISQIDPYYDFEEKVGIALDKAFSPDDVDEDNEQEISRISTELDKLQLLFDEFEVRLARQRRNDEMQDDSDSMARFNSILDNPESHDIERELAAWGKNLMENQNEVEATRTTLSRLDACLLRDDLEGYKKILNQYTNIYDLIEPSSENDGMMEPLGEVSQISPLNKAVLSGKIEFCKAVRPFYPDLNFGRPLTSAIAAPGKYENPFMPLFETRDDLGTWDTIPELEMKAQNLVEKLKTQGTQFQIIEWLIKEGVDLDQNLALHTAILNLNQDTVKITELLLENGADVNYVADPSQYLEVDAIMLAEGINYPISPLDCTLLMDDTDFTKVLSQTKKLLVSAGAKYHDVVLAIGSEDLTALKLFTESEGGGDFKHKGVSAVEIAVILNNFEAVQYLTGKGASLKYVNPDTDWNLLETYTWANRGDYEWRKSPDSLSFEKSMLEALLIGEGLEIKHLYPAVASNDPGVFKSLSFGRQDFMKRVEFSKEFFSNFDQIDNSQLTSKLFETSFMGTPQPYNVMELVIKFNADQIFDVLSVSSSEYRVSSDLFNTEYTIFNRYSIGNDKFVSKWKELAESGIRLDYTSIDENKYSAGQYSSVDRKIRDLFQQLKGRMVGF